jgi:osmoprotectant transport system permease protein
MADQLALLPDLFTAHLQLTLIALTLGAALSVPLGVWLTTRPDLEPAVLGVASTIQTIPSLALLAIMVPAIASIGAFTVSAFGLELSSIGRAPAVIALTLYSVLPILRNTVTGIAGVDPSLVEAARGVGMSERQKLRLVELPLAAPVIVAGLRTSAVWVVGTATLSTPVGARSLGNYIFSGLQTRNYTAVLVGCVAAAGLAMLLDALIRTLESGTRQRNRRALVAAGAGLAALYVVAIASFAAERWGDGRRPIAIGSKTFTEQYILSEILSEQIRRETGLPTEAVQSLGSTVAFDALGGDALDVYVDYSGTIWATIMKREGLPANRDEVLTRVGEYVRAEHGIEMVGALGFENTYALGMRAKQARELGISRISQLAPFSRRLEIGGDYEFFQRAEWAALRETYGLAFRSERSMDSSLMYQAVAQGEVDVISAFSTDGRIEAFDIALLDDDRGVIPPYDAIVLASPRLVDEHPEVIDALRALVGSIDAAAMRRMNLAVDRDGQLPIDVAREWLDAKTPP